MTNSECLTLNEVQSRLKAAIPQSVPLVGSDDVPELVQDGTVLALRLLAAANRSGKEVTGGNLAYYTLKTLRVGRRSTGQRRGDVLHPMAQLNGSCRVHSLDEPIGSEDRPDDPPTLGETLAAATEDPAQGALRRLDWASLLASLDATTREVLTCLASGEELTHLVPKLKRSRSALQNDKQRLARLIREHLGPDVLSQVQESPRWVDSLTARRDKFVCRFQRQMEVGPLAAPRPNPA